MARPSTFSRRLGQFVSIRKRRARPKPKYQPPLTPMIDVTFQLLLFFILTTQFRQAEGYIPGTLPRHDAAPARAVQRIYRPVRINLRAEAGGEGVIYQVTGAAEGRIDGPGRLHEHLAAYRVRIGSPQVPIIIAPGRGVRWRYVVEAFNAAVRAKFTRIAFAGPGREEVRP
ncbi:MAG: biopolymer transporter ExbD [Phycisphaerae bacterium]|nr:biopolymer transporter ExbD [Phycisphaerae bacterium]